MAKGSRRAVFAALGANVAIAIAKFVGFMLSGSSPMLTEAIHSGVDSANQALLLVGQHRASKRRDRTHPLGYGMETYFWSFIVALIVFAAGGVASIYEGVVRVFDPAPSSSIGINLVVLGVAAAFEGYSFSVSYRQYLRVVGKRETPLWTFIKASKDPSLFATLLEDGAALIGIALAVTGVLLSDLWNVVWADGAASLGIGIVLIGVAIVLANETRSLIAGEAVAKPILDKLRSVIDEEERIEHLDHLVTLHLGPEVIMVAATVAFAPSLMARDIAVCVRDLSSNLKAADRRVSYVYVKPEVP